MKKEKVRVSRKPKACPVCGSDRIATYLLGMPDFSNKKLQKEIDEGKIIIGGCCITEDDPKYHCFECDTDLYFSK